MGGQRERFWRLARRTSYGLGIVVAVLVVAIAIMYARTKVPPVNAAARAEASVFTYRDGTPLARVGRLDRVAVRLGDVPTYVRGAVLAAEDRGYYSDPVVSPTGLARAGWAAVSGGATQGGSGIAQQYVKVAYLSPEQTMTRKVKELFIAVKLTRSRSRNQIFEQYLNTVYFGRGAYGIQAASQAYFGKNVGALTPAEGALLAGVIQAPSYLDPELGHTAETRARWRYVIDGMMSTGALPRGPRPAFPRVLPARREPTYGGQRGYLIERITAELHAHGFDDDQIYRRGLRVTSTIDPAMEAAVPGAVARATGHDKDLETGVASVRPGTGEILAAYGGRDYLRHQYDNALLAALPPGSSLDPFVLAGGLEHGIGLRSTFEATPFGPVVNDDDATPASANLLTATARSYNAVFARLSARSDPSSAVARAGLGGGKGKSGALLAASRGGWTPPSGVRAVDEAAAYATLASGRYAAPHILSKVTDMSGKVLLDLRPRTRPAFSSAVSADVAFALGHAAESGRGHRAALAGRQAAGKLGTTAHNAAAWFCGYTPDVATAVVMYRASNRPIINIGDAPHQEAAVAPAEIWHDVMTTAETGRPVRGFPPPAWTGETKNFMPPPPQSPPPVTKPPAKKYYPGVRTPATKQPLKASPKPTASPTAKRPGDG